METVTAKSTPWRVRHLYDANDLGPNMLIGKEWPGTGGGSAGRLPGGSLQPDPGCPPTHVRGQIDAVCRRYQWVKRMICDCTDAP